MTATLGKQLIDIETDDPLAVVTRDHCPDGHDPVAFRETLEANRTAAIQLFEIIQISATKHIPQGAVPPKIKIDGASPIWPMFASENAREIRVFGSKNIGQAFRNLRGAEDINNEMVEWLISEELCVSVERSEYYNNPIVYLLIKSSQQI